MDSFVAGKLAQGSNKPGLNWKYYFLQIILDTIYNLITRYCILYWHIISLLRKSQKLMNYIWTWGTLDGFEGKLSSTIIFRLLHINMHYWQFILQKLMRKQNHNQQQNRFRANIVMGLSESTFKSGLISWIKSLSAVSLTRNTNSM